MRANLAFAAAAAAVSMTAASAQAASPLLDGGFEAQAAGVEYCYFHFDGVNPACGGGAWDGANGGGLQVEDNSPWPGQATPDGSYYAFIQNSGYIEQTFTAATTGHFTLSWLDAGRPLGCCFGNQHYDVTVSGIGAVGGFDTTTSQPFSARSSSSFYLTAGEAYTVRFQGTRTGGDDTAFIDQVVLNQGAVPEPAAWALMIVGFGSAGAMLRRRRAVLAA
jgi:hypothetical protein